MQDDTNRKPTQGWLPLECESDLGVYNLSIETPTQNMEIALCERVTETPWYVIRMPGVAGGVAPRGVPLSRFGTL